MKNKKIYILFSILLTIIFIAIVNKTFQNDTFSAIKIGDYIIHNGIDFVEHFNFNELTYHNARWLFNVIISFNYNNFGFFGVYLFTIISSIVLGLTMFNTLLKRNKNLFISFAITLLSMILLRNYIAARAQIVSYILLFLEILFLENMLKNNKKIWIVGLIIVSVLIANVHTTIWPMTLILFLPYFAEYFISRKLKNTKVLYTETNNFKLLLISFFIIAISGLLTPLGLLPYTYMYKTMSGISSTFILELRNTNIFTNTNLLILLIVYVYLFVYLKKKIKISDIFMITGLFIMSVMAVRNVAFLIVIGPICLSRLIIDNTLEYKDKMDIVFDYLYKDKIILCILSIFVLSLSVIFLKANFYKKPYVDDSTYPVKAADYIVKNVDLDNLRLYNNFNDGAYLEFRGIKVFLDSRSEVYCKEFNDTNILDDWIKTNNLYINYRTIFDKYNFNYILINTDEILNNYVSIDKDYEPVYQDEYFVLYKKVE